MKNTDFGGVSHEGHGGHGGGGSNAGGLSLKMNFDEKLQYPNGKLTVEN